MEIGFVGDKKQDEGKCNKGDSCWRATIHKLAASAAHATTQHSPSSQHTPPTPLSPRSHAGVRAYIESRGMLQISDTGAVEAMIQAVLDANPKQVGAGGRLWGRGYSHDYLK